MAKIIHIHVQALSGGDRKYKAKQVRQALGLHAHHARQAALVHEVAAAKLREARAHECLAWSALMFCGGPAAPSPAIGAAIDAGFYRLQVACTRCGRAEYLDLRLLQREPETPVHLLEAALFCEPCSAGRVFRQRARLVGLVRDDPPEPGTPRASGGS